MRKLFKCLVPQLPPTFYTGGPWPGSNGTDFASSFGDSLTSAISSLASAPGSSSGGSGGSGEAAEVGDRVWLELYRVAILWMRNASPRGHITLFFALQ